MRLRVRIDHSGNFAIRVNERAAFEYCDHYLMKFSIQNCRCREHSELYCVAATPENVDDCDGFGFSVNRMKDYLHHQNDRMKGFVYYSRIDNTPVGCIWVAYKGANEFQYRIRKVDAFGFNFAVRSEYRGQGIIGFMIYELLRKLEQEGIDTSYASVRRNNRSALRAYEKCGAVIISRRKFFRIAGVRISYPII